MVETWATVPRILVVPQVVVAVVVATAAAEDAEEIEISDYQFIKKLIIILLN